MIFDEKWKTLENILAVFRPFEIVMNGLSYEDASLLKSENCIKFILKEFDNHSSVLDTQLKVCMNNTHPTR